MIMLRNLLELNGIKKLSKTTQSKVSGGSVGPYEDCENDNFCDCGYDPNDPTVHILQDC